MSHRSLQQALVIALHDPTFVAAMHEDPAATLGPLGLGPAEWQELLAVDRRAFATDALRARRVLRVLAEELKIASTLALWETRSAAFAMGFFSSRFFRAAVVERAPLVLAFGAYLAAAALATPQLPDVVELEMMQARARRDVAPRHGIALAPGVASGAFDAAILDTVRQVERFLFELGLMPQLGFCADGPVMPELPAVGGGVVHLLASPSGLTPIDEELHRVLSVFPVARTDLARALVPAGIPAHRADALVAALVADGLLVEDTSATSATSARPPG